MKYAIVIPDGCADEPQASLGDKTPLQAAHTPNMDRIAELGRVGRANHVPADLPAGSAVANMSLLGYDPNEHFSGRAPLEAAAQGIELGPYDWAVRCNLVTVANQTMKDFTAGHVSSAEAAELLESAQQELSGKRWEFVPGVSYRNLLIYRGEQGAEPPFSRDTIASPPHDLTDRSVVNDFPRGPGSELLNDLMSRSVKLFADHPVNLKRVASGKLPASNIWLWGLGKTPQLESFQSRHAVSGKMITAVDLLRGIASLIGWDRIEAPGATGYIDTDYASKGRCAIQSLPDCDLICVHVEAPDEASHEGDVQAKVSALESIDQEIVGPLHEALQSQGEFRFLVSPDHPTPLRTKTHSHGWVPWAMCGSGLEPDGGQRYDEVTAAQSESAFDAGWRLMGSFLGK
jgi:2,3-bisphosphoglycerate-independent phosphoglycerate mutase